MNPRGTSFRRFPLRKKRVSGRPSATSTNRSIVDEWFETYTVCAVGNGASRWTATRRLQTRSTARAVRVATRT